MPDVPSSSRVTWAIEQGDAAELLRTLPEASAQTCVTSPPYFGLRDYGTATWVGGDPACPHKGRPKPRQDTTGAGAEKGRCATTRGIQPGKAAYGRLDRKTCRDCGAERLDQQIGLEETPDEYVARLVEVYREVWRVLQDNGTLWLNLGDSYASDAYGGSIARSGLEGGNLGQVASRAARTGPRLPEGLKPKQLIGIPWRVAFALQADGWYLRSDIIWHKPNPMPESVRDRPTKAHEYLFLLAKSERYYYDAKAIEEPASFLGPNGAQHSPYAQGFQRRTDEEEAERRTKRRSVRPNVDTHGGGQGAGAMSYPAFARNRRSVWTVPTRPFTEAHFATFPPALIEPCILAGSPGGGLVLDPCAGAGTTGLVALRHGRRFWGAELNPDYVAMARRRIVDDAPLFNSMEEPCRVS